MQLLEPVKSIVGWIRVIHGKTTPEDIYNADTLLMYSSEHGHA
jgi:hypothetical protein